MLQNQNNLGNLVNSLDRTDLLILSSVYEGQTIFPLLCKNLKELHHVTLTNEAVRKKVKRLVNFNLLNKLEGTYPARITTIIGKEEYIKELITEFIKPFVQKEVVTS